MPFAFTMPKLSPTMDEGTIAKWHKKEGDFVEAGETLLEITTDKATIEHAALDEGYLRKILLPEGKTATVNDPIALFTETKEESIEGYKPKKTLAPKIKTGGHAITFGWNTNGFGKKLGFEVIEVLLVHHGTNHNDTLVTVERKFQHHMFQ